VETWRKKWRHFLQGNEMEAVNMLLTAGVSFFVILILFLLRLLWEIIVIPVTHYRLLLHAKEAKIIVRQLNLFLREFDQRNFLEWRDDVEKYLCENLSREWADEFMCLHNNVSVETLFTTHKMNNMPRSLHDVKNMKDLPDFNKEMNPYKYKISLGLIKDKLMVYTFHGKTDDNP
jgi:hypothetical protein